MTTLKKFFFGPPNPGCYTKNPYKHPLFFLDSYSPSHKLSIKPLNGCPSTKKKSPGAVLSIPLLSATKWAILIIVSQ